LHSLIHLNEQLSRSHIEGLRLSASKRYGEGHRAFEGAVNIKHCQSMVRFAYTRSFSTNVIEMRIVGYSITVLA